MKLAKEFYTRPDVVQIAQEMLGKHLYTNIDGVITGGMIVETEAYSGENDKACHAHLNRRTNRTQIMYSEGGVAYVYLVYGMYHLFNVITNQEDRADAVLVRAIEPLVGIEEMVLRRGFTDVRPNLTKGPGVTSIALGINKQHYGTDLTGNTIWLEDKSIRIPEHELAVGPRIGIDYAGEDALLPWRFWVKGNKWVSKKK